MKVKKLMTKVHAFINSDQRSQKKKEKRLKEVIKTLRTYEKELAVKLENEPDLERRAKLKKKKALAHEQRKKGLKTLKALQQSDTNTAEKEPPAAS